MIDYNKVLDYVCPCETNENLRHILLTHSENVAKMAVSIARNHEDLNADEELVYAAAMLHDIGIVRCDASGISCFGSEPYIRHGLLGAELLREWGELNQVPLVELEPYMRVCARHTGTGLTAAEIREQQLPLPAEDLVPETIEEQIVCYADKFFSKTHPDIEKTYEQACKSLRKFGEDGLRVFAEWHVKFS